MANERISKIKSKYFVMDEYGYTDEKLVDTVNMLIDKVNELEGKALEQQICDNDCEHCDWATCPKMEEETETITVSKGCLKARTGRFVVYDVEYLKKHIDIEAKIYGQPAAECDDCISRQEALNHKHIVYDDDGIGYSVVRADVIAKLPPVTPKAEQEKRRGQPDE